MEWLPSQLAALGFSRGKLAQTCFAGADNCLRTVGDVQFAQNA